jgi:hypothetical protein
VKRDLKLNTLKQRAVPLRQEKKPAVKKKPLSKVPPELNVLSSRACHLHTATRPTAQCKLRIDI